MFCVTQKLEGINPGWRCPLLFVQGQSLYGLFSGWWSTLRDSSPFFIFTKISTAACLTFPLTKSWPRTLNDTLNPALTSELSSGGAVWWGLPAVLLLFELLHPAHVEPPVALGYIQDEQVKDLPLLHHCELHFGPQETLCVVAIETGLPHVNAGDEEFILRPVRARWQEGPFHHGQSSIAAPLGHNAGERDVLTLLGHRKGGRGDCHVDGQTQICGRKICLKLLYSLKQCAVWRRLDLLYEWWLISSNHWLYAVLENLSDLSEKLMQIMS